MNITFYWTSAIGLARALLAVGTFLTLLFNPLGMLLIDTEMMDGLSFWQRGSLFFLLRDYLFIAKIIALFILLVVVLGYYPFITGVLHWYVTYSLFNSSGLIDGGDHASSVLTLLLIPITLTDRRINHWRAAVFESGTFRCLLAKIFLTLVKIQVCAIYLHAFVGKIAVPEWLNGTATFYWLTHEHFGINDILRPLYNYFLGNAFIVTLVTWGTLVFEFFLASAIFIDNKKVKSVLFFSGVVFHFFILINHGLVSFFFAMSGALCLYLISDKTNILLTLKNYIHYVTKSNKKSNTKISIF